MKLIWTWRALDRWLNGRTDPAHTINAPDAADSYVCQLRRGTPWLLIDADGVAVRAGTA